MIRIDGENKTYFEVRPINWTRFIEISNSVSAKTTREMMTAQQRARLLEQVKHFSDSGTPLPFTAVELSALPSSIGKKLTRAAIDALDTEGEAKIIDEGDGITKPILVKLGQPLVMGETKIEELEFMAKTFGEIEAVLAHEDRGTQSIILIETVVKPVTSNLKLQALPSWAADAVAVNDGSFIAQKVLPRFLE